MFIFSTLKTVREELLEDKHHLEGKNLKRANFKDNCIRKVCKMKAQQRIPVSCRLFTCKTATPFKLNYVICQCCTVSQFYFKIPAVRQKDGIAGIIVGGFTPNEVCCTCFRYASCCRENCTTPNMAVETKLMQAHPHRPNCNSIKSYFFVFLQFLK